MGDGGTMPRSASAASEATPEAKAEVSQLDTAGRWLLTPNYPAVSVGVLVAVGLYVIGFWRAKKRAPEVNDIIRAVIGAFGILSGIAIFCVFNLTTPPAFDKLGVGERNTIGIICTIMTLWASGREILEVLNKARTSSSGGPPAPPPAGTT